MIPGINKQGYRDLLLRLLPRPVTSEADYETIQAEVDRLVDMADLSVDEQDYLDLLGLLLSDYEARHEVKTDYELRGVALLKGLMTLHNLKQKDLVSLFKTKSIISEVLNGHRPLTVEHINKLAAYFNLPHSCFFEPLTES